jgi:hypothetical protein
LRRFTHAEVKGTFDIGKHGHAVPMLLAWNLLDYTEGSNTIVPLSGQRLCLNPIASLVWNFDPTSFGVHQ